MTDHETEPPSPESTGPSGSTVATGTSPTEDEVTVAAPAAGAEGSGAATPAGGDPADAPIAAAHRPGTGPPLAAHAAADAHGHPSEAQYILIAVILAVITAVEVGISYAKGLGDAAAPLLLILAATKFVIVVGFFMHLRYDNHLLRRIFATGIALALIVYFIVFLMLGIFTGSRGVHS
jgi:cytochrome c oxidase subunit 4